jgi:8-oxo-dGTP pyrophosphatase MutT (NUDIX family)
VLLLLRAGRHNTGKWGLPGGNVEPGEADLLVTAKREAAEELGGAASLPSYLIAGQPILIK